MKISQRIMKIHSGEILSVQTTNKFKFPAFFHNVATSKVRYRKRMILCLIQCVLR